MHPFFIILICLGAIYFITAPFSVPLTIDILKSISTSFAAKRNAEAISKLILMSNDEKEIKAFYLKNAGILSSSTNRKLLDRLQHVSYVLGE